jgi:hypothetical protein
MKLCFMGRKIKIRFKRTTSVSYATPCKCDVIVLNAPGDDGV